MDGLGMSRDFRVVDAAAAESTAKRYLESQKKVVEAKVIRIWPPKGAKGVWEVDGIVTISVLFHNMWHIFEVDFCWRLIV